MQKKRNEKDSNKLFDDLIHKTMKNFPTLVTPPEIKKAVVKLMQQQAIVQRVWYFIFAAMIAIVCPFLIAYGGYNLGLWDPNSGVLITSYVFFGLLIVMLMFPITLRISEENTRLVESLETHVDNFFS